MSISVSIEGQGVVAEFPDDTPQSVIDAAIKRDFFGGGKQTVDFAAASKAEMARDNGLTNNGTMYPAGVDRNPLEQEDKNLWQAPRRVSPTPVVEAEQVAPDLVSAFEFVGASRPETVIDTGKNPLGSAAAAYFNEIPAKGKRPSIFVDRADDGTMFGNNVKDLSTEPTINEQREVMGVDPTALSESRLSGDTLYNTVMPAPALAMQQTGKGIGGLVRQIGDYTHIDAVSGLGRDIADLYKERSEATEEEYPLEQSSIAANVRGALTSMVQMVGPGMLASYRAGNALRMGATELAAANIASRTSLLPLAMTTEGDAYDKYRDKGHGITASSIGAASEGLFEYWTEKIGMAPIARYMTATGRQGIVKFMAMAGKAGVADQFGEQIASLGQGLTEKVMADPTSTNEDRQKLVDDYFKKVNNKTGYTEFQQSVKDTFVTTLAMNLLTPMAAGAARKITQQKVTDAITDGTDFTTQSAEAAAAAAFVPQERQDRIARQNEIAAADTEAETRKAAIQARLDAMRTPRTDSAAVPDYDIGADIPAEEIPAELDNVISGFSTEVTGFDITAQNELLASLSIPDDVPTPEAPPVDQIDMPPVPSTVEAVDSPVVSAPPSALQDTIPLSPLAAEIQRIRAGRGSSTMPANSDIMPTESEVVADGQMQRRNEEKITQVPALPAEGSGLQAVAQDDSNAKSEPNTATQLPPGYQPDKNGVEIEEFPGTHPDRFAVKYAWMGSEDMARKYVATGLTQAQATKLQDKYNNRLLITAAADSQQPGVSAVPPVPDDIKALVDGKTAKEVEKTIAMVNDLNPERGAQIEAYYQSTLQKAPAFQEQADVHADNLASKLEAGGLTSDNPLYAELIEDRRQRERAPDPTTGLIAREHHDPTLERAFKAAQESKQPFAYADVDLANLGGLNEHSGGDAAADPHIKGMLQVVKKVVTEAHPGSQVHRKGGDEFAVFAPGVTKEELHKTLATATQKVHDYTVEQGLDQISRKMPETEPYGTGIHYGVSDLSQHPTAYDARKAADALTEISKQARKEAHYGNRQKADGVGTVQPEGQTEGIDGGIRTDSGTELETGIPEAATTTPEVTPTTTVPSVNLIMKSGADGTPNTIPYQTEHTAQFSLKAKKLEATHEVVPHGDGFAIQRRGEENDRNDSDGSGNSVHGDGGLRGAVHAQQGHSEDGGDIEGRNGEASSVIGENITDDPEVTYHHIELSGGKWKSGKNKAPASVAIKHIDSRLAVLKALLGCVKG